MPELLQSDPTDSGSKPAAASDDHLDKLLSPELEKPWLRSLFENIRDAIHPPKLPPLEVTSKPVAVKTTELEKPWHRSLFESIRDTVNPPKLPPLQVTSQPVEVHGPQLEKPWLISLYENIRDAIRPPKLPPLEVTSKPVAVKSIWGLYGRDRKSGALSIFLHVATVALLFTVASSKTVQNHVKQVITPVFAPDLAPYVPKMAPQKQAMGGGGGGGDRSPLPASKGRLPRQSLKQFTPPMAVVNNPNPKLLMEPTIIVPPDVPLPNNNMPVWGDPLAKIGPPSNGPGSGGGIGSGSGGGVGSGKGGGFGPGEGGGVGGGVFRVGGGVTAPALVYKVEPEYSEEARKAKYQGTVVLYVEVDPSGRAKNLRVVRSLGLGLDEKAMEAVNKWRFRPGYKDGKPVTVAATIEVNFRLL